MADLTWINGIGYMGGGTASVDKYSKIGYMAEASREVKNDLGKDDFLKLLAAQLQYQNPLEPQNDTQFASQLAQYSSLEQMSNMNTTLTAMSNSQAYSMVGKFVIAEAEIEGKLTPIDGTVDCVFTQNGVTYAQIRYKGTDYSVPVSSINTVVDKDLVSSSLDKTLLETSNLIGREVTAKLLNDKGEYDDVTGTVKRVAYDLEDMEIYAFIDDGSEDGKKVLVKNIYDIKQTEETPDPKDGEGE